MRAGVPGLKREFPVFYGDTSYWQRDIDALAEVVRCVEELPTGTFSKTPYVYLAQLPEIIGYIPDDEAAALAKASLPDQRGGGEADLTIVENTLDIIRKDLDIVSEGKYCLRPDSVEVERHVRTAGQPLRGRAQIHVDPSVESAVDVPHYVVSTRCPTIFYQGPVRLLLQNLGDVSFEVDECLDVSRFLRRRRGSFMTAPAKAIVRFSSVSPHVSPVAQEDINREFLRAAGWLPDWDSLLAA